MNYKCKDDVFEINFGRFSSRFSEISTRRSSIAVWRYFEMCVLALAVTKLRSAVGDPWEESLVGEKSS